MVVFVLIAVRVTVIFTGNGRAAYGRWVHEKRIFPEHRRRSPGQRGCLSIAWKSMCYSVNQQLDQNEKSISIATYSDRGTTPAVSWYSIIIPLDRKQSLPLTRFLTIKTNIFKYLKSIKTQAPNYSKPYCNVNTHASERNISTVIVSRRLFFFFKC